MNHCILLFMSSLDSFSPLPLIPPQGEIPHDDPARLEKRGFFWKRFSLFRTYSDADLKIMSEVKSYFQHKYHIEDETDFQKVWKRLGAKFWNPSKLFTDDALKQIDSSFKQRLVYYGKGIEGPPSEGNTLSDRVHQFVHTLAHGASLPDDFFESRTTQAILLRHDSELMGYFREALQEELLNLAKHLPVDENEALIWNHFKGNLLSLLPFSYPESGTTFTVPRLEGNTCKIDTYAIEVIPLDFPGVSSPMNALGMTPVESNGAPNLLIFMGTTFPAGRGFAATLFSDFTPGYSVGNLIYNRNKHKIETWLIDKTNTHAIGLSLGGALVFHALRHHPEAFAKAEVFSPPGLYPINWRREINKECEVNIYTQKGDLVTQLGTFPEGSNVSLYSILPHHEGVNENPLHAHLRIFTGCKKVTVLKKDIAEENSSFKRILLTKLHQFVAPFVIFLPLSIGFIGFTIFKKIKKFAESIFISPS